VAELPLLGGSKDAYAEWANNLLPELTFSRKLWVARQFRQSWSNSYMCVGQNVRRCYKYWQRKDGGNAATIWNTEARCHRPCKRRVWTYTCPAAM